MVSDRILIAVLCLLSFSNAFSITYPLYRRSRLAGTGKLTPITSTDTSESSTSNTALVSVAEYMEENPTNEKVVDVDSVSTLKAISDPSIKTATGTISDVGTDITYFMNISIGTPARTFSMVIDTGSYYTWVYGANCSSTACTEHEQYSLNDSSSGVLMEGTTFGIEYTTSSISGTVVNELVSMAGFKTRFDIGVANTAGSTFADYPVDGLMGLSASDIDEDGFPGILTTLRDQGLISKRVLGVSLAQSDISDDEGSITFGGVDSSKYKGDIIYTSTLNDSLLWNIPVGGCSLNGNKIDFGYRYATVDTGTTLLVMSSDDALKFHSYIKGSQTDGSSYAIPCNTTDKFELEFGGQTWPIGTDAYIGSPISKGSSMCASNIQGISLQNSSNWVLGDVFLKTVYSVFNMDDHTVGFANKTIGSTSATPEDTFVLTSGLFESLMSLTTNGHDSSTSLQTGSTTISTTLAVSTTTAHTSTFAVSTASAASSTSIKDAAAIASSHTHDSVRSTSSSSSTSETAKAATSAGSIASSTSVLYLFMLSFILPLII